MSKETGTVQEVLDMIVEAHNSVAEEVNRGLLPAQSGIDAIGDRITALEHRVTGLDRGHVALSNRAGALYDAMDTRLDMQNKALTGAIERLGALERGGGTGGRPRSMDDFFDIGSKVKLCGVAFELCGHNGSVFLQNVDVDDCRVQCNQAFRPKGTTRREIIEALDEDGYGLAGSTINGEPLLLDGVEYDTEQAEPENSAWSMRSKCIADANGLVPDGFDKWRGKWSHGAGDSDDCVAGEASAHAEPVHDIAWAVARLREGRRVRRSAWDERRDSWTQESMSIWVAANTADLLATDWEVVS